jgi:hypothetical protein
MERCIKCGGRADFICPYCHKKYCRSHMELRYTGQDRGFRSRYMCPSCWKRKQRVLNEQMINARTFKPKKYFYGS